MKSMKSLSFRLWSRAWLKKKNIKRLQTLTAGGRRSLGVKIKQILHRTESKLSSTFTKQSSVLASYPKKLSTGKLFSTAAGCFDPLLSNVRSVNKGSSFASWHMKLGCAKRIYRVDLGRRLGGWGQFKKNSKKNISTSATYYIPTIKPQENEKSSNSNKVKPEVSYINVDLQKLRIIKDNKKRSGIYRWTNKVNGKIYIGSSLN
jgi:hypothetical protein